MTEQSRKKIGILQTGTLDASLSENHGQFPQMFQTMLGQNTFDYVNYSVVENELPDSPLECDGWIITGSKHAAYEDHHWIRPLENFVRTLIESGKPTVGICFGHQIMAQAMGGIVEKFPGGRAVGLQTYKELESGQTVRLRAFHQDQVTTKPASSTVTHSSEFCEFAGLQYSPVCVSYQPHPEFTDIFLEDLIKQRLGPDSEGEGIKPAFTPRGIEDSHEEVGKAIEKILTS